MTADPGHRPSWQAAFTFVLLMIVGVVLRVVSMPVLHPSLWIAVGTGYVALLAVLLANPRNESVGTKVLAFTVILGVVQVSVANELIVRAGIHVEPFIGAKLMALALALVAPPSLWIALASLMATAVVPLAEFYHWPSHVRQSMPINEPWTTLLYSAVALGLLFHRRHQLESHRRLVRAEATTAAYELYMRKFLAVRDMTNSPLQSIELSLGLLRASCPDARPQLDRIGRQLERLASLSEALARYEPKSWTDQDYAVDSLHVLRDGADPPPARER